MTDPDPKVVVTGANPADLPPPEEVSSLLVDYDKAREDYNAAREALKAVEGPLLDAMISAGETILPLPSGTGTVEIVEKSKASLRPREFITQLAVAGGQVAEITTDGVTQEVMVLVLDDQDPAPALTLIRPDLNTRTKAPQRWRALGADPKAMIDVQPDGYRLGYRRIT